VRAKGFNVDFYVGKRVVLVGVGKWGRNHLDALIRLLPKSSLGFYEPDERASAEASKIAPSAHLYHTYEAILNDEDVAAVVVAAPANLHFPLALEAVRSGKHVFVEKPLAMKVEEGVRLVEEADVKRVVLAIGHILIFDPAYARLKQMVEGGGIGDALYIYAERAKLGTIREFEDVIFSLGSHDVAMVIDLLGISPKHVSCVGTCALRDDIIDAALLSLMFEDGVKAYLFSSWLHPQTRRSATIVGTNGSIVWDETAEERLKLLKKGAKVLKKGPKLFERGEKTYRVRESDKLESELRDFLESIKSGEPPKCDGRSGLEVLKVLSAAQKSAAASGMPVEIG
jgi:UDP-2-acetamido-3-amino-2,3-dideoxy-glucuronate N-acetyltransferase